LNHVAMVIPGIDRIAGAERQMIQLAHGLRGRGWRVSVVALSGTGGSEAAELTERGVEFLSLGMRKGLADPRGWIRFHRWLRGQRPDVVHAHLPHAAWMARWSRLGAPMRGLVDTLHSSSTGTLGRRLGYRWSNWLPDKVTAVSHAVAEAHLLTRMTTAEKLAVVANGVDVGRWRPDSQVRATVRRELGLEDEFLWLAAGRLDPVKDYPTLLWAMVNVPETARLIIAGGGQLEGELRRLSGELGVESRVRFLGFTPDVCRLMQAADAFVLCSRWEGLPMALLEAAACGLPAVATDVPGTREAVADGETGFLAAAGSAEALQGEMSRMMRLAPEERRDLGERAREMVVVRFSLDKVLDRLEGFYGDLLRQHPISTRWARGDRCDETP
jgi:glycosyltransferase involved in cell wall biosynthesis